MLARPEIPNNRKYVQVLFLEAGVYVVYDKSGC